MNAPAGAAEDLTIHEFTDATKENGGGMSGAAQAGLCSSMNASGNTC